MTDTGPPYPPGPLPGSNGIGFFQIGVSPIGDIPSFDLWKTVISQYANSPILTSLLLSLYDALDPTILIEQFFDSVMNIETAVGYGLDNWGRILGVNRVLSIQVGDYFGFNGALPGAEPFNQAPFYTGAPVTSNYALTDSAYRPLLLTKAAANITDCSIPAINQILLSLFPGRGACYVTDGLNMTMTYTFNFALSALDIAIVEQSGAIPKPVGVAASVVVNL